MPEFIQSVSELPVDTAYEVIADTEEFLLVNKSGNIPVHEGGRYQENSLTKVIEKKYGKAYPVYRLDRETSGLILFAKKRECVHKLFSNIGDKEYVAIVQGNVDKPMTLDFPIGECKGEHVTWKKCVDENGKKAKTEVYPIKSFEDKTLVRVIPKTGRQHQIRVHLSHIGHPIMNDKIYGDSEEKFIRYLNGEILPRQLLHMKKIRIYDKTYEIELPHEFLF
jgi:23S rRNA pseudouridine955/2504/2580 synthase/23S rRNA pseudouridine1911/1915/1917 synthase